MFSSFSEYADSRLYFFACRSACRCFSFRLSPCSIKRFRLTLAYVFAVSVRAFHLFNCFRNIRHQKIGLLYAQNGIRIWLRIVLMSVKNRRRRIHQRVKTQFFADALICNFRRNTSQSTPPPSVWLFGRCACPCISCNPLAKVRGDTVSPPQITSLLLYALYYCYSCL